LPDVEVERVGDQLLIKRNGIRIAEINNGLKGFSIGVSGTDDFIDVSVAYLDEGDTKTSAAPFGVIRKYLEEDGGSRSVTYKDDGTSSTIYLDSKGEVRSVVSSAGKETSLK
jgi:hypothetical protein